MEKTFGAKNDGFCTSYVFVMSLAPFNQDTDDFTGVFVSITTSGMPFTHNTRSKRRTLPAGPKTTASLTAQWLFSKLSKSIKRTGTCSSVSTNLNVWSPRSSVVIRSLAASKPSLLADRIAERSTGRTSSTRSGASAITGFNRMRASTSHCSQRTSVSVRGRNSATTGFQPCLASLSTSHA